MKLRRRRVDLQPGQHFPNAPGRIIRQVFVAENPHVSITGSCFHPGPLCVDRTTPTSSFDRSGSRTLPVWEDAGARAGSSRLLRLADASAWQRRTTRRPQPVDRVARRRSGTGRVWGWLHRWGSDVEMNSDGPVRKELVDVVGEAEAQRSVGHRLETGAALDDRVVEDGPYPLAGRLLGATVIDVVVPTRRPDPDPPHPLVQRTADRRPADSPTQSPPRPENDRDLIRGDGRCSVGPSRRVIHSSRLGVRSRTPFPDPRTPDRFSA